MAQSQSKAASVTHPARKTLVTDGLLGRLDYLSTVSGGGYTGGMYGRLVATFGLAQAQAMMAKGNSSVLEWLRRNGRYLTPAGSRDIGIAVATYLRSWLAIHTEFLFACILLGLVVVAPHLWQHSVQVLDPRGWERWHTPWWALSLAFWAATAPGLIAGYWAARDSPDPVATSQLPGWRDALFLLVAAAGTWVMLHVLQPNGAMDPVRYSLNWPGAGVLALISLVIGQVSVMGWMAISRQPHGLKVARLRNWLTRALRLVMMGTLVLAGLGGLDVLSWWVLQEFQTGNQWLWGGVGVGGVGVVALRTLMQPLQQMASKADNRARDWLPRLLNFGSLLGLLALVTVWLVLLQWFIFAPETFKALRSVPAWLRASLLVTVWGTWVAVTAGNAQMANTSSLHSFYRARLIRAYLAVGNRQRSLEAHTGAGANVTKVVEGDDTRLQSYKPEMEGGPIHLINTCLNQTRDDQSGLYNADRKGTAVTATWRGFELGAREFVALKPEHDAGTLGRWVAVSGAAASPGAGAYTSRGLALLVYFLGVRLGHWMRAPRERGQLRWLSALAWRVIPKPMMLTSEASATFYGVDRPWWYLSDGGHFENSGVYPLLKRELEFIILSDAGCDAQYEFGDLENLVRKARIDFGAEIDFYSREEAATLFTLGSSELTILSPEDMANNHSCRGVLLARIRYRARPGPRRADGIEGNSFRPEGTLLVIKPNLHDALDVDLLAYARKNDTFPHESTGDQSFDEAQWESYHRLGEDFGRALHESWLAQLPGWRNPAQHGIRVAARLGPVKTAGDIQRAEPLWRRSARATAIGTTLGVGASGTLLLSLWQVQDQLQRNRTDEQTEVRQLFTEVSTGLQSLKGSCPMVPEHVVTQASLLLDLRGSPVMRPLEQAGLERLAGRIAEECTQEAQASTECLAAHQRMQSSLCSLVVKKPSENTALNYWHPGSSPQEQARDGQKVLQALVRNIPAFGSLHRQEPAELSQVATASPPAAAAPEPAAAALAQAPRLDSCLKMPERVTLYIHIYDETSRAPAAALRTAVLSATGSPVVVAPVENVVRSADMRQERRPVPWPVPTLVLHSPASHDCARAIAKYIGVPWVMPGQSGKPVEVDQVWLRDLPRSLQPQPGVIELWLPPVGVMTSESNPVREEIVGSLLGIDQNQTSWLRSK